MALFKFQQRPDDKLQNYVGRFNQQSVHTEDRMPEVCIAAFENGLHAGPLNRRRPASTMTELKRRTQEFIQEEQSNALNKDQVDGSASSRRPEDGKLSDGQFVQKAVND